MKILLVFPSIGSSVSTDEPPLGVLYLASALRGKFSVKVVDAHVDNLRPEGLKNIVYAYQPDVVGISCNTLQVSETYLIAETIKRISPKIIVVTGGAHPSIRGAEMLSDCESLEVAVIGEGEQTMVELVDSFDRAYPISRVKGIVCRVDGRIVKTAKRDFLRNLDSIPFPAHDLNEPLERYKLFPIVGVLPSRGCPFNCLFCSNPVWGRTNRRRTPKNIADELEWLTVRYGIKGVDFHDDIFNLFPRFVMDLCDELIRRKLNQKLRWSCEATVNKKLVSEELLNKMKEAGCRLISFGIESGNQKILDNIRKGITLEEVRRAVMLSKKAGLAVRGFFMIGNIGEDVATVFNTIRFATRLDLNSSQFTINTPFPGSAYYDIAKKEGWITDENYLNYTERSAHIQTKNLSKEQLATLKNLADFCSLVKGNNLEIYSNLLGKSDRKKIFLESVLKVLKRLLRTKYMFRTFLYLLRYWFDQNNLRYDCYK